ncbi:calcineurin-like phosphoesterase family protein [Labedella gwakjiensis]|uniref:Calcineurin-like phosphoesterase family protein n=2 Tax=Labedella gwakjiensis TaxID=390269 RepID=A0A2P8GRN0_9MICO|nr:calcineurin-like phosphoesterase family protein [Labedella gwakjiensis]RUQ85479.1 metallophosphoesterase [Labedella gwakjiensis]
MSKGNTRLMRSLRRTLTIVAAAALVAAGTVVVSTPASASTATCSSMHQPVRQSVNPTSRQSLITFSSTEIQKADEVWGFTERRGDVFDASPKEKDGLVPVYRMYQDERFVWIPRVEGSSEWQKAQSKYGYQAQAIEFWASPTAIDCGVAVHRMYKKGVFRMEADAGRISDLVADGWADQGPKFWASRAETTAPAPAPAPQPTPQPAPAPEPERPGSEPGDTDSTFSLAIIPDTQQEVFTSTRFAQRNEWLVENKDELDIRYAIHTGDVTNWGETAPEQYRVASDAMKVLDDGGIPAAIAIGNHDSSAVCVGGGGCRGADASVTLRKTELFNSTFPATRYTGIEGVFEQARVDNNFQTFSAGGADFLILTLELWPRQDVVEWAKDVVATHPEHNVIINTHFYLDYDGSIAQSSGYGVTSPQSLFDELVSVYPNVKMVFSGHVGDSQQRTDVGKNGNTIASFLGGFHSTANPVKLIEIDTETGTITAKVHVPQTDTHLEQFDARIDGMDFIG